MTTTAGSATSAAVVDLDDDDSAASTCRLALETCPPEVLAQVAPGLLRLLENLRPQTVEEKHRKLRLGNPALQERLLGPLPSALELLCSLGYSPRDDGGEAWLCLNERRRSAAGAAEEARRLRELVRLRWQPQPWPCPTCTLHNVSGAAECAACGSPRPSWAEAPKVPPPRLDASGDGKAELAAEPRAAAVGVRRPRGEVLRERERILAEARADRQRFEHAGAAAAGEAPQTRSAGSSAQPAAAEPRAAQAALRIRLPDGSTLEEVLASSQPLLRVFERVDSQFLSRSESLDDYALLQAIPRRVFIREVLGSKTLAELSLAPSAALSVLRAEDRGRVQSGGVETALLTGDIEGLSYEEMLELESRMGDGKRARRPPASELARAREGRTRTHTYVGAGAGCEPTGPSSSPPSAASADAEPERRCAICLADFEVGCTLRTLWCGHSFHRSCVDRWLADKDECPVCRVALCATG